MKGMNPTPDLLRAVVRGAVQRHGITRVARVVDVTPQTLRKYIAGGTVRSDVRRKLQDWADPSPVETYGAGLYGGSGL
jgi:hypothetical protein